jgi:hypothetical protein
MLTPALFTYLLATRSVSISWKPAVGAVYHYKWAMSSEDYPGPDGVTTLSQEEDDTDTVKTVKDNGDVVMEVKVTGVKAKLGSSPVPSSGVDVITQTVTTSAKGLLLERLSDSKEDKENPRFEMVERLIYPDKAVSVGDSWTFKEAANPVKGTYDNFSTFTFRGSERIGGILAKKISVDYRELGILLSMSCEGTFWVSPDDGSIVKKDLHVSNLSAGRASKLFNLRIRVDRTDTAG